MLLELYLYIVSLEKEYIISIKQGEYYTSNSTFCRKTEKILLSSFNVSCDYLKYWNGEDSYSNFFNIYYNNLTGLKECVWTFLDTDICTGSNENDIKEKEYRYDLKKIFYELNKHIYKKYNFNKENIPSYLKYDRLYMKAEI